MRIKMVTWNIIRNIALQMTHKMIDPVARWLIKLGVTPVFVTATGLFFNIVATGILVYGAIYGERGNCSYVGWAGFIIFFAGLFDMLDGQVARNGEKNSKFNMLFDSVIDRYSELTIFFGICYYLILHGYFFSSLFGFIALTGSMMVSYTRARAEGLGISCTVGFMQRPERVTLISVGAILCGIFYCFTGNYTFCVTWLSVPICFEPIDILVISLIIVAIFSNVTAIARINHSRKVFKEEENASQ